MYRFAQLRTSGSPEDEAWNDQWLGPNTLGIEITREPLAVRCGLGNIDPQHRGEGGSSAIEAAMNWPLPSDGSIIVFQRLDKDSLGAGAVLDLGLEGRLVEVDRFLLIRLGAMDRHGYTPHSAKEIDQIEVRREVTDALNFIVNADAGRYQSLPAKIGGFIKILTGKMSDEDIDRLAAQKPMLRDHFNPKDHRIEVINPRVAFTEAPGKSHSARDWGNKHYDVFVVHDSEHRTPAAGLHDRWTLVRKPGCFDRNRCEAMFNAAEAQSRNMTVGQLVSAGLTWGGPRNIISSAEGRAKQTRLTKDEILKIVIECADSGNVT